MGSNTIWHRTGWVCFWSSCGGHCVYAITTVLVLYRCQWDARTLCWRIRLDVACTLRISNHIHSIVNRGPKHAQS
jgi:hypothetical protein